MAEEKYVARLKEMYQSKIVPALMEKYKYSSVMQVPHLEKIVVNIGVGDATQDAKLLENAVNDLTVITGQKPLITNLKFQCDEEQITCFDCIVWSHFLHDASLGCLGRPPTLLCDPGP